MMVHVHYYHLTKGGNAQCPYLIDGLPNGARFSPDLLLSSLSGLEWEHNEGQKGGTHGTVRNTYMTVGSMMWSQAHGIQLPRFVGEDGIIILGRFFRYQKDKKEKSL